VQCALAERELGGLKRGERTKVRSALVVDVGAEYLRWRAVSGDQAVGPALQSTGCLGCRRHSLPWSPRSRRDETVLRLFTETEGFTVGRSSRRAWSGSPLNSPSSQAQR